jgi:hypothetical protein
LFALQLTQAIKAHKTSCCGNSIGLKFAKAEALAGLRGATSAARLRLISWILLAFMSSQASRRMRSRTKFFPRTLETRIAAASISPGAGRKNAVQE